MGDNKPKHSCSCDVTTICRPSLTDDDSPEVTAADTTPSSAMTSSAASTSSTPAAATTFSYRLDGRVTIDDDVNWPYSTALRNGDAAEIARYEARFCSEVRGALL